VDGDRGRAGPPGPHHRADRGSDVRPRQLRVADRADRTGAAQPDDRGVQPQRRRHLRTARAGRSAVRRRVVAHLRHPARRGRRRVVPRLSRGIASARAARAQRRAERTDRGDAGAGGESRPVLAAGAARLDQGGAVTRGPKTDGVTGAADRARAALEVLGARARAVWAVVMPHLYGEPGETRSQRILRRVRIGLVIAACVITLQSVLLVVGAWRNDRQIERNMGVAEALVLDAGPRRSTIEFVTPERVTYRPELGVLYPSELDTG